MKREVKQLVVLAYVSAAIAIIVFLPGLVSDKGQLSHQIEHLLIITSAAIFAFSLERLRQLASMRRRSSIRD